MKTMPMTDEETRLKDASVSDIVEEIKREVKYLNGLRAALMESEAQVTELEQSLNASTFRLTGMERALIKAAKRDS